LEQEFPNGKPHHVTLFFGVERSAFRQEEGRIVAIKAWGHAADDRIQAVAVDVPLDVPCGQKYPHITVSWQEGVKPAEANAMLAKAGQEGGIRQWEMPLTLDCRIEWQPLKPRWQLWLSDRFKQIWRY
jgi:hypothetical protein